MKQSELIAEVSGLVEERIERGETTETSWLTQAIVSEHPGIEGDDVDWYLLCAHEHVSDTVRTVVRRYKPSEEKPDSQLILDGFERVQRAYAIERSGKSFIVPTHLLSDGEIATKVSELRGMAAGCHQHADELERFRSQRIVA